MRKFTPAAALSCLIAFFSIAHGGADSARIVVPLQRTGADPNASGLVTITLTLNSSSLTVQATNLTPRRTYAVTSGGFVRGSFTTDAAGRGRIKFARPVVAGTRRFDFDPRGSELAVLLTGTPVLRAVISGSGEPPRATVAEDVNIRRLVGAGSATARYRDLADGTRRFSVSLTSLADGDWPLFVDGIQRGTIRVRSGAGRAVFDNSPATTGDRPLTFDPRDAVIDISRDGALRFSGKCEAKARGINFASPSVATRFIPSTGVDPDGFARARFRVERDARRKFDIELEDVPEGAYDLTVNGAPKASIHVVTVPGGTEGQIEFASVSDDEDELPLTFDPLASTYAIALAGTVYFEGQLAASVPFTPTNSGPLFIRESLTSTGLDTDASGDARYEIDDQGRHKFRVEIEDVAVGPYELWIGGVLRGSIRVQDLGTAIEGDLDFSIGGDDPDELPLTFEPRGTIIEVKNAAGTFFSHLFGIGATNGAVAAPARLELPLFSLGVDANGTAKLDFARDDRGRRRFEVELEDVTAGDYSLLVDGVPVSAITVIAVVGGTEGQIEFEDEPEGGEFPLTFDPLGKLIAIERNGVRHFERTLPLTP